MTNYIILVLCLLVLLAYVFDITGKYTRIPGVILLILLGIFLQTVVRTAGVEVPNMKPFLPVIGTLGLILIVLEASLDLKLERSKLRMIVMSASSAIILLALFVAFLTFIMVKFFGLSPLSSLVNAVPLGVISSAVAIPAAANLGKESREFVVYESSLSDIIGILLFDFILAYNEALGTGLLNFTISGFATIIIAFIVTALLAVLLHKITYHINYVIIITFVILAYVLAKLVHLPALLLILIFGLVLSNNRFFENDFMNHHVNFPKFRADIESFRKILGELTFIVRSFFFIMFGYYANISGFLKVSNIEVAVLIVVIIFLLRWLYFTFILSMPVRPLFFFSPRGLITILLFLSIPQAFRVEIISEEVIIIVILLSMVILTAGNMIGLGKEAASSTVVPMPGVESVTVEKAPEDMVEPNGQKNENQELNG